MIVEYQFERIQDGDKRPQWRWQIIARVTGDGCAFLALRHTATALSESPMAEWDTDDDRVSPLLRGIHVRHAGANAALSDLLQEACAPEWCWRGVLGEDGWWDTVSVAPDVGRIRRSIEDYGPIGSPPAQREERTPRREPTVEHLYRPSDRHSWVVRRDEDDECPACRGLGTLGGGLAECRRCEGLGYVT